jgi:alpha-beta hydrolase superfamily lysophospholipase
MKRVAFGQCVGWLHDASGDTGVVLCATVGHEAIWSHRALRHLADDLAAAGVPALRFDYPGTGDAPGIEATPGSLAQWVRGIVDAAAFMRARTGARRIVLCGVRLGAMLAVLAADAMAAQANHGADGLVLLAPPVTGHAYLREMRALQANWRASVLATPDTAPAPDGALEVLGYRLGADTVEQLEALRLDQRPGLSARRVLLFDAWPASGSPVGALAAHYQRAGACVTLANFPEYQRMMQCADAAGVPEQAWRDILHWLGPVAPGRLCCPTFPRNGSALATLVAEGVTEWPVWLDGDRQFGILCTPAARPRPTVRGSDEPSGTVVIFPNTGGTHHIGDCRLFVTLSRQLARIGVAALRLDVSALGDTPLAAREIGPEVLLGERSCRDVGAVVDCMRARGYDKVVLAGIGSGAFLSLHAALRHSGVDGLVLASLPAFGGACAYRGRQAMQSMRAYLAGAHPAQHRRRLPSADAALGALAWSEARSLSASYLSAAARRLGRLLRLRASHGDGDVPPASRFARSTVQLLHARGVRTDLLYGMGDSGLAQAREHLGSSFDHLKPLYNVNARVLPWCDPTLWLPQSRDAFAAQVVLHVRGLAREAGPAGAMPPEIVLSDP